MLLLVFNFLNLPWKAGKYVCHFWVSLWVYEFCGGWDGHVPSNDVILYSGSIYEVNSRKHIILSLSLKSIVDLIFSSQDREREWGKKRGKGRERENWKIRGGREKGVQLQCSSWRTTGSPSSSLEMTILRNKSQDETIRVCLGIFTTALWNEKLKSNFHGKIPRLTFTMPCYIIKLKINYSRKWVLSNLVGGQITSNAMW